MILVIAVGNGGLPRSNQVNNLFAFVAFAGGEGEGGWNGAVDIESEVGLGFIGSLAVVGPGCGKRGVDQGAVNGNEIAEVGMSLGEDGLGPDGKSVIDLDEKVQPPGVQGLKETALFDALARSDRSAGKGILFQFLHEVSSGIRKGQMIVDQDVKKLLHGHLKGTIPFRFCGRDVGKDVPEGLAEGGIGTVVPKRTVGPAGFSHLVSPWLRRVYENVQPLASS